VPLVGIRCWNAPKSLKRRPNHEVELRAIAAYLPPRVPLRLPQGKLIGTEKATVRSSPRPSPSPIVLLMALTVEPKAHCPESP